MASRLPALAVAQDEIPRAGDSCEQPAELFDGRDRPSAKFFIYSPFTLNSYTQSFLLIFS